MAPISDTQREIANILGRSAFAVIAKRGLVRSHAVAPVLATKTTRLVLIHSQDVQGAQGVTLGVIAAYVVGIAILWNIPYIRWVLWPFKVNFRLLSLRTRKADMTETDD